MQDKTSLILQQKGKTNEGRRFELKAGRELHVVQKKNNKQQNYAFSILASHDQCRRKYQYKKRWLTLALLMIGVMSLIPELQQRLQLDIEQYVLSIISGLFFAALLFFLLLVYTFQRSDVFYSIHTGLPLVEFWVNNPSRKEYQHFISTLENSIRQHKEEMRIAYDKQLSGELRTLRRVTEAGMLSESVYLAAKAKLLLMSDVNYRPPTDRK